MSLLIIADDLSGAAETAGAFASIVGGSVDVLLARNPGVLPDVSAVDTHSREMLPDDAYAAVAEVLAATPPDVLIYKKIDSLLRGNPATELRAILDSGRRAVVAPAVPRVGRTVAHGVVHVDGVALHNTDAWASETGRPPRSIPELLGVSSEIISVDAVRSGSLTVAIEAALQRDDVPVCDAENQDDLDAIARAIVELDEPVAAVAAGGLARSLAGALSLRGRPLVPSAPVASVCVVVGTRSGAAIAQVNALVSRGMRAIQLTPGGRHELGDGDIVVTLSPRERWDGLSVEVALGTVSDQLRARYRSLVLTGGSTARTILVGLGVDRLHTEQQLEDGVVLSTTAEGVVVVTKPGSFGDDECLVRVVEAVRGRS